MKDFATSFAKNMFFVLIAVFVTVVETQAQNITIGNAASSGGSWSGGNPDVWTQSSYASAKLNASEIVSRLNAGTSVTIASGFSSAYIVDSAGIAIYKTSGSDATLTFHSNASIQFAANDTIVSTSGKLNIIFDTDADNSQNDGYFYVGNTASLYAVSNNGDIVIGAGSDPYNTAVGGFQYFQPMTIYSTKLYAGSGLISLRSQAGGTSGYDGVELYGPCVLQTTSGNITIVGTGANSSSNFGSTGRGVVMSTSGGSPTIQTATGAISITGYAGSDANNGYGYPGFSMYGGSQIISTGSGTITINGTGGSVGYNDPYGVTVGDGNNGTSSIQTVDGNISITATAGSAPGASQVYGMAMNTSNITATGIASVTINAAGGSGTQTNYGMYISNGTVQTNSGKITVTSTGGAGTSGGNDGIRIYSYPSSAIAGFFSTSGTICATGTAVNGGTGIFMQGTLTAIRSGGDIILNANRTGSGNGTGMQFSFGSRIVATGSGNIKINATAGSSGNSNYGVWLGNGYDSRIVTADGNITINATGGGDGTGNSNSGILMQNPSAIYSSGTGRIDIKAQGGNPGYGFDWGGGNQYIESDSGKVFVTALAGGSANYSGIYTYSSPSYITAMDSVSITAVGAGTAPGINSNYTNINMGGASGFTHSGPTIITAGTASGNDAIAIDGCNLQGTGSLTLQPYDSTMSIGIAGGSGTFNLNLNRLGSIQSGFTSITFGRSNGTGTMTVGGYTFNANTKLRGSTSNINLSGAVSTGANNLAICTGGSVSQTNGITCDTLTLNGNGVFTFDVQNNTGVSHLTGNAGTVKFRNDSGIPVANMTATDMTLNTTGSFSVPAGNTFSKLTLEGSAAYSIPFSSLSNLTLSGTASLTLSGDLNVTDTLALKGGVLGSGGNTLTVGISASHAGYVSRTSGYYDGLLKRWIAADTASTILFPLGRSSNYYGANVGFTGAPASGGTLTGSFSTSAPGNNGFPLTEGLSTMDSTSSSGYWAINAADGLSGGTYSLDLTGTNFNGIANYKKVHVVKRTNSSYPWALAGNTLPGTGSNSAPVGHRTGFTGFSEFALSQATAPDPAFSASISNILFGGIVVNTTKKDSATITNNSGAPLNIFSVTSTSASFVLCQGDTTIAAGNSATYYIRFKPTTTGAKSGNIIFVSDEPSSPDTIKVSGNGLFTEPTIQASAPCISDTTQNSFKLKWTNGNGTNRIVLIKLSSAVNTNPADGSSYTANANYGSGSQVSSSNYVVAITSGSAGAKDSVIITGASIGQTYYVKIFEFNGSGGGENYLTTAAPADSVTIPSPFAPTPGNALSFDGSASYVDLGNPGSLQMTNGTVEAWIKTPGGNSGYRGVVLKVYQYGLLMKDDQLVTYDWQLADFGYDGTWYTGVYVNDNQWHHVALVFSGAQYNIGSMTVYLDGVNIHAAQQYGYGNYNAYYGNSGYSAQIGGGAGLTGVFNGKIEEVRIWNTTRTNVQIRDDMHHTSPSSLTGLVSVWELNEGSGSTTADAFGSNNGTLVSSPSWVLSTAPIGLATTTELQSFTSGAASLGTVSLTTTDAFDNATDLVSTSITVSPDSLPSSPLTMLSDRYWIVTPFGTPGTFAANLTFTVPATFTANDSIPASHFQLFHRNSNDDGSWTQAATGSSMTATSITFNGVASLGQFMLGTNAALPVELAAFSATSDRSNATLSWKTATEVNSATFEIERAPAVAAPASASGQTVPTPAAVQQWAAVGSVPGAGTSNSPKSYTFTDRNVASGSYSYRLRQIDRNGAFRYSTNVQVEVGAVPRVFSLSQNYPNPFNPSTTIEFTLPEDGRVTLKIYDIVGREVATLVDGDLKAGFLQQAIFDASRLASGVYFSRLQFKGQAMVKKLLFVK